MNIKHAINRAASYVYFKTMSEYTLEKSIPIAKKYTRKGNCPVCKVSCGSNHNKTCIYKKI